MKPRWTDNRRQDGTVIVQTFEGNWMILPSDDRKPIEFCPCCDMPLRKKEGAMFVADQVYPVEGK